MEIRKARTKDAIQIHALINKYAKEEQMLPRTLLSIYENIRDFQVAAEGDRVLGCSALHFTWGDMAEVRSLAVDENAGRKGIGGAVGGANIGGARPHGPGAVHAF